MSKIGQTNAAFNLIEEGDKILVGLSGGKDSLTMIHALREQQRRAPFNFELIAVTVTYGMGEDLTKLSEHCAVHGITHHIHATNTYEIATDKIRKNSSFCSFFSRMRRGASAVTPVETQQELVLHLNMRAAAKMGVTVPEDVKKTADKIYE